jgi:transcriptional regulator with XRE-family HTH domain
MSLRLSQEQLSAMIGMSRGYYSSVESGHKRTTTKLTRLVAQATLEDPVKLMREYEIWRGLKP